jgi:hypothetical protein
MDTGKLDPSHSFGVKSDKNQWGTAETIRGDLYGYEEDKDLGKSITPGFRNVTAEVRKKEHASKELQISLCLTY